MLEDELLAPGVISATYVSALRRPSAAPGRSASRASTTSTTRISRITRALRAPARIPALSRRVRLHSREEPRQRNCTPHRRGPARRRRRGFAHPRCRLRTPESEGRAAARLAAAQKEGNPFSEGSRSSRPRGPGRIDVFFLGGAQIDGEGEHQPGARRRPAFPGIVRLGFHVRGGEADDPLPRGAFAAGPRAAGRVHLRGGDRAALVTGKALFSWQKTPLPAGKRARARDIRANRVRLRCSGKHTSTEVPSSEDLLACCAAQWQSHRGGLPRFRKASVGNT